MRRYIVGKRGRGTNAPELRIVDHPPTHTANEERFHFCAGGSFVAKRGVLQDIRNLHGALVVARALPEDDYTTEQLAAVDAKVEATKAAYLAAQRERQEYLDSLVAASEPLRTPLLVVERAAHEASPEYIEAERKKAESDANFRAMTDAFINHAHRQLQKVGR